MKSVQRSQWFVPEDIFTVFDSINFSSNNKTRLLIEKLKTTVYNNKCSVETITSQIVTVPYKYLDLFFSQKVCLRTNLHLRHVFWPVSFNNLLATLFGRFLSKKRGVYRSFMGSQRRSCCNLASSVSWYDSSVSINFNGFPEKLAAF